MPIFNEIRARRGYSRVAHNDFLLVLRKAYEGLVNNPHFRRLPVDMAVYKTKMDAYAAAITATMTRASMTYVQRDSLRKELAAMLELLSVYVTNESNNNEAIFPTSGLEKQPMKRAPQTSPEKPKFRRSITAPIQARCRSGCRLRTGRSPTLNCNMLQWMRTMFRLANRRR